MEDVLELISARMGVVDRQAVEICLSAHLPTHPQNRFPSPWISVETQMISAPVSWFTFGWTDADNRTYHLSNVKYKRPRLCKGLVDALIERRKQPKLFIDSNYMKKVGVLPRHPWNLLAPMLLRLRVECPYSHLPSLNDMRELNRLTKLALNLEHREVWGKEWKPTEKLLWAMKILVSINPELSVWDQVYQNVSSVVSNHAALFGREKPIDVDISAGMRVIRDSIRWRERQVLDCFLGKDGWWLKIKLRELTGVDNLELQKILNHLVMKRAIKRNDPWYKESEQIREFFETPV